MGSTVDILPPASPPTQEECVVLRQEFFSSILTLWNHHCKCGLSSKYRYGESDRTCFELLLNIAKLRAF